MDKRTCDMEVGEAFTITQDDGTIKNMVITSKETNEEGLLIVQSSEVVA